MAKYNYYKYFINFVFFAFIISIPFKDAVFEISLALLNFLFIIQIIKEKNLSWLYSDRNLLISFGLIFISMSLSNWLGSPGFYGWKEQFQFFLRFMLLFYSVSYFLAKKYISIRFIAIAVLVSLSLQAVDGIYQLNVGTDFIKHNKISGGRITAVVFNPNPYGLLMMCYSVFLVYILFRDNGYGINKKTHFFVLLMLETTLCCLLFSGSRSAWVGCVVAILLLLGLNFKRTCSLKGLIVLGLCFGMVFFIFQTNEGLTHRIELIINGNTSLRLDLWKNAFKMVADSPIFGYGIDENLIFYQKKNTIVTNPHNIFVEIIAYLGITGLTAFLYQIYLIVKKSITFISKNNIYLVLFVAIITAGMFDHSMTGGKIFLSIFYLSASVLYFESKSFKIKKQYG